MGLDESYPRRPRRRPREGRAEGRAAEGRLLPGVGGQARGRRADAPDFQAVREQPAGWEGSVPGRFVPALFFNDSRGSPFFRMNHRRGGPGEFFAEVLHGKICGGFDKSSLRQP